MSNSVTPAQLGLQHARLPCPSPSPRACSNLCASLMAQLVKNPPGMWEIWVQSLGWEDSPGEGNDYPLQYSVLENPMDYIINPWGHKESDTTKRLSLSVSTASVMPSSYLILCHSLLLLPSIFPSIRVFTTESAVWIRWPKDWSFSFSIGLFNDY